MNALQVTTVGGHTAAPTAPAHTSAPVEPANHSAVADAVAQQQAAQAAASARARATAEQHAAQQAAKKAAQAAPPPPPVQVAEPRFDRKVGFVPGTSKVYIDLVNVSYQKLAYRIYGPTANPVALPVLPAPPQPAKASTIATDAYAHAGAPSESGKDVAVA